MNEKISHEQAINEIIEFYSQYFSSGTEQSEAENELASRIPSSPFSNEQLEFVFSKAPGSSVLEGMVTIFAKANHAEILPYALRFFDASEDVEQKLLYASVMAFFNNESGYQYIEDVFRRFMRKENDMSDFDIEYLVYLTDEILTNNRGKEMMERFRKEANYFVEWETYTPPED